MGGLHWYVKKMLRWILVIEFDLKFVFDEVMRRRACD